uniref:Zinc finger protein 850-like n=1 Tax=Saccoglossus kowalevskii TaxID=10224 RepID=A0ABM0MWX0_SACKO|nr:PREDICTED: zinc finger protein 850-like [Saccoglossus kowalevskii]
MNSTEHCRIAVTETPETMQSQDQAIPIDDTPYNCKKCGKSFSTEIILAQHVANHADEKPYTCKKCKKSFSYKSTLAGHSRTHTGERPFTCKKCGKSFNQKSTLQKHYVVHTGDKPYTCKCGKEFTQKSTLVKHYIIHTGERPFSCKDCGKSFRHKRNLTEHYKIHSDVKPYSCEDCGLSFRLKGHLKRHCLTMHGFQKTKSATQRKKSLKLVNKSRINSGKIPYSCKQCRMSFLNQRSLTQHCRVHKEKKGKKTPPGLQVTTKTAQKNNNSRFKNMIVCSFCLFKSRSTVILMKHYKKHHVNHITMYRGIAKKYN